MGNKGRDLVLWLLIPALPGSLLQGLKVLDGLFFFGFAILLNLAILYYAVIEMIWRKQMLGPVCLVPVFRWWSRFLMMGRIGAVWSRAYEVHFQIDQSKPLKGQLAAAETQLLELYRSRPGLYYWETALPLPRGIRCILNQKQTIDQAFWARGVLFPRIPFFYHRPKNGRPIRSGAILVSAEDLKGVN